MANYSITLNFLLPKKIVEAFKKIEVSGNFAFDWRDSDFCHCTVKAISLCDEIPEKETLDSWIAKSKGILNEQKSFKVLVKDIAKFPTVIFANIYSDELVNLHKKLFKILPSSQPQFENENYVPHASIGMLTENVEVESDLKQNFGEFEVKGIQLIIWNLKDLNKSKIYHRFSLADTP